MYNKKAMFKKILSIVTLLLVGVVVYGARNEIVSAFQCIFGGQCMDGSHFSINFWIVLLLIPEQLFMYYSAGKIFFSYMAGKAKSQKNITRISAGKNTKTEKVNTKSDSQAFDQLTTWQLARISFELNFVNHAIPSGGVSGLGYITWRLKNFGATAGQVSFMYLLRYVITILANQTQTILAIIFLLVTNNVPSNAIWMVGAVAAMSVGVILGIILVIVIVSNRKLIDFAAKKLAALINGTVRIFTFGKKKQIIETKKVQKYFLDLHEDFLTAKRDKKILVGPVLWGFLYNFLEIATYEIVAIAIGHPEIFPQIMVAEALGSVVGAVLPTPGGVGGYEGSMVAVMTVLGSDLAVASTTVLVTRMIVLLNTIVSGYGFYQNAISKIGKEEKQKIFEGESAE
mgnify:CR=1 FL=1